MENSIEGKCKFSHFLQTERIIGKDWIEKGTGRAFRLIGDRLPPLATV